MKLDELRGTISKYSKNELQIIVSELYKNLPKRLREEIAADDLISDPAAYTKKISVDKPARSQKFSPALEMEIGEFVENLQAGNYIFPNRIIHKTERPKWRFKAKNYYKILQTASADENSRMVAATLLDRLYRTLCYGCGYQIVSSDDPFASAGIAQSEFLNQLLLTKVQVLPPREFVEYGIELILTQGEDRNTLKERLIDVFVSHLRTTDMRELAIESCQKKVNRERTTEIPKRKNDWRDPEIAKRHRVNELTEIYFYCCVALCEFDRGVEFYKANYDAGVRQDKEINLYCLLRALKRVDQKDLWVREYESARKAGIMPRDVTKKMYQYIKVQGHFPKMDNYF